MKHTLKFINKLFYCTNLVAATAMTLASMAIAQGAELNIQAEFKPDPSNPFFNKFENKTEPTGYCFFYPSKCQANNMFSLRTPIAFNSKHPIVAKHTDPRQGAIFYIPTEWRDFMVTHSQTGAQETVRVRIVGFGSQYRVAPDDIRLLVNDGLPGIDIGPAHRMMWGVSWNTPPGNCSGYSDTVSYNHIDFTFFWTTPSQAPCQKQAQFNIPRFRYNYLDFAYELQTPNPLKMSTGSYFGNITYTLGPNEDFDMGDVMIPTDSLLSLNFTLNVQHTLKVAIPPGGNKVELTPKGGWQQWLQKGRVPEKIYRDQTVLISASSRFKMQLSCEQMMGDTCAISNGSHEVPVDVLVSMPNGIANDGDSSAVSRKPLSVTTAQVFKSTFYVDNRASSLHFEIQKRHVEEMLSEQGNYKGNITVIWDSDL